MPYSVKAVIKNKKIKDHKTRMTALQQGTYPGFLPVYQG
jgi:hypothetical protein